MSGQTHLSAAELLQNIDRQIRKEFDQNKSILSFDHYLGAVSENTKAHFRGTAEYTLNMLDYFGKKSGHFSLFDEPVEGLAPKIVGLDFVQSQLYSTLKTFVQQGVNNKLILLHGPNGSAKSSLVHALMSGLEKYSATKEGALYSFNWVFPVDKIIRSGIGLSSQNGKKQDSIESFATISDEDIAAKIGCDFRDHPLLLIPKSHRKEFVEKLTGSSDSWERLPLYLSQGEPCHRCKEIFNALLTSNNGELKRVLKHVQVERFYLSKRFRKGLVTIEPQMHVDAQIHQVTASRSLSSLPASLQSLNLFATMGDLVDGSRGIVEYSDLLKRPLDTYKYLLGLCESGSVNIGTTIATLDTLLIGSTNELQLDAFKEMPDFTSFKARIELIRVPYLRSVSLEQQIYESQMKQFSHGKHVAPHVAWTTALWAILTRLKKPNSVNYPSSVGTLIASLTPLEKAKIYDTGELPSAITPEDRKILKTNIKRLSEEYLNIPYYEGRIGVSVREMRSVLFEAAQNSEYECLSPLSVLRQLELFVKKTSEYEFLNQEIKDGYHDAHDFINVVRNEYLNKIDREVRDAMGIYEFGQWEEFLKRYVQQISLVLKKEKSKNQITGKMEDPDFALIAEFEKIVDAPEDKETFRTNTISQVGAWSLDHPNEPVIYAKVFPDFWKKLERYYYESQKSLLKKMADAILVYDTKEDERTSEGGHLAHQTLQKLQSKYHYCAKCAKEVVSFLLKQRY